MSSVKRSTHAMFASTTGHATRSEHTVPTHSATAREIVVTEEKNKMRLALQDIWRMTFLRRSTELFSVQKLSSSRVQYSAN